MKKIVLVFLATFIAISSFAQENDTTLLRSAKVAEVTKYQLIHAFVGRQQDTCILEHVKYNEQGLPVYILKDYGCSGYVQKDETIAEYDGRKKIKELFIRNRDTLAIYYYTYHKKYEEPLTRSVVLLATGDTTHTDYTYYRKKRSHLIDSTRASVRTEDGVKYYISKNTYDKKKKLLKTVTTNSDGATLAETTMEYDAQGNMESLTNASFVPKTIFEQTFFKYDQNGNVVETNNTHNRQNLFFYTEEGLVKNMMGYNAKGELEIEYIYKYTFRE